MNPAVHENELQAYVDKRLEPARRAAVEAWLAEHPEDAARVEAYRHQNEALHALFDPLLSEPLPTVPSGTALQPWRHAAAAAWLLVGGAIGFYLHVWVQPPPSDALAALPRAAHVAHVVYTPEVLHPVEVGAESENHLVGWLSKRLGTQVRAPELASLGYALVGGRLLPGERGAAAQFMYQDDAGARLTLYVSAPDHGGEDTAFRYAMEGGVSTFYWINGDLGYALSGELGRERLLEVATVVYRELEFQ